ncbi:MAG TPA: CHC2 zinc finger domain-containing protein [Bryobacteraceae bacterium]|nr:CHC2 zinc finger domain-containing protein [Bryobacteraceae bacterium]
MLTTSNSSSIHPPGGQYNSPRRDFHHNSDIADLKRAADIVGFIGRYVNLRKSGVEFAGRCPFHQDKTPSFYVHSAKQLYYCHGCGVGGDVIKFAMDIEGLRFRDALKFVGDRCGVQISNSKPTPAEKRARREEQEERELAEHFRFVEGAGIEFSKRCQADLSYKAWLRSDLAHAHAICGLIVGMIALAQERDGDFRATQEAQ